MPAEQALGSLVHGSGIQWGWDVPNASGQQCRAAAAVEDAEAIGAAVGGEARVPVRRDRCGIQHHDRMRLHVEIQGVSDRLGAATVREVDMRDLALGMNTRIGAAGDNAGDRLPGIKASTQLVPALPAPTVR